MKHLIIGLVASIMLVSVVNARDIGSVSTSFKLLGSSDKIVIQSFDDPEVKNVAFYLSRAKTGGLSGTLGIAEDTSDASIACREIGKVELSEKVASGKLDGSQVFKESTSIWFKKLQVVRFYDKEKKVLVYLTYSDKLIEGSPKNSVTIIPVR